jgi:hypothetical protein
VEGSQNVFLVQVGLLTKLYRLIRSKKNCSNNKLFHVFTF